VASKASRVGFVPHVPRVPREPPPCPPPFGGGIAVDRPGQRRVTIRIDHVAGAIFTVLGIAILAISGDLPIGNLSFPCAGMMPKLVGVLMMMLPVALIARAGASEPFATLSWSALKHAAPVVLIAAAATAAYEWLGFLITMSLMLFALTAGVERRNVIAAALFSVGVAGATYGLFTFGLKSPLEAGLLGFGQ